MLFTLECTILNNLKMELTDLEIFESIKKSTKKWVDQNIFSKIMKKRKKLHILWLRMKGPISFNYQGKQNLSQGQKYYLYFVWLEFDQLV